MYEERFVDVASYVCRILDQIPTSPHLSYVRGLTVIGWGGGGGRATKLCDVTLVIFAVGALPVLFTRSKEQQELSPNCPVQ